MDNGLYYLQNSIDPVIKLWTFVISKSTPAVYIITCSYLSLQIKISFRYQLLTLDCPDCKLNSRCDNFSLVTIVFYDPMSYFGMKSRYKSGERNVFPRLKSALWLSLKQFNKEHHHKKKFDNCLTGTYILIYCQIYCSQCLINVHQKEYCECTSEGIL